MGQSFARYFLGLIETVRMGCVSAFPGISIMIFLGWVPVVVPGKHIHHPQSWKSQTGILELYCVYKLDLVKMHILMQ